MVFAVEKVGPFVSSTRFFLGHSCFLHYSLTGCSHFIEEVAAVVAVGQESQLRRHSLSRPIKKKKAKESSTWEKDLAVAPNMASGNPLFEDLPIKLETIDPPQVEELLDIGEAINDPSQPALKPNVVVSSNVRDL
ncbi:hypothetical protein LINPERHAP1_LOCUS15328 [Linum perenne]